MSRACFMCDSKQPRKGRTDVSFHGFPTDIPTRTLWLEFCRFSSDDNVSRLKLCSKHFTPNMFVNYVPKSMGGYFKLKPGAYPTIRKTKNWNYNKLEHIQGTINDTQDINDPKVSVSNPHNVLREIKHEVEVIEEYDLGTDFQVMDFTSSEFVENGVEKYCHAATQTELQVPNNISEILLTSGISDASTQTDKIVCLVEKSVSILNETSTSLENEPELITLATPKRRFFEPRYIGDVISPHLATPRRAKRSFRIAKQAYEEKCKKLRSSQSSKRYLEKKIVSLKDLIQHLKQSKLVTEDVAETLLDTLPESIKQ